MLRKVYKKSTKGAKGFKQYVNSLGEYLQYVGLFEFCGRLLVFLCLFSISLIIMPFLIIFDIIKFVKTTFQVITEGF